MTTWLTTKRTKYSKRSRLPVKLHESHGQLSIHGWHAVDGGSTIAWVHAWHASGHGRGRSRQCQGHQHLVHILRHSSIEGMQRDRAKREMAGEEEVEEDGEKMRADVQ